MRQRRRWGPSLGAEDVVQLLLRFKVDRHPSKMIARGIDLIRKLYQVPNFVEFKLPGPSDQPIQPPPGHVAVYKDYFFKGLWLPFRPFFREALLNLDFSLPQLNPNVVQSLVAFWSSTVSTTSPTSRWRSSEHITP